MIVDYSVDGGWAWLTREQPPPPNVGDWGDLARFPWRPGMLVSSDLGPGALGIVIAARPNPDVAGSRHFIPVVLWSGCPYGEFRSMSAAIAARARERGSRRP